MTHWIETKKKVGSWIEFYNEETLRTVHSILGEIRSDIEAELYLREEAAHLERIRRGEK